MPSQPAMTFYQAMVLLETSVPEVSFAARDGGDGPLEVMVTAYDDEQVVGAVAYDTMFHDSYTTGIIGCVVFDEPGSKAVFSTGKGGYEFEPLYECPLDNEGALRWCAEALYWVYTRPKGPKTSQPRAVRLMRANPYLGRKRKRGEAV
jgi:hypothetical protein